MNKILTSHRNQVYIFVMMIISPFLSFFIAFGQWKSPYAKNVFIGVIIFIGMTSLPEGDLQRYQDMYYFYSNQSFEKIWIKIINLGDGKVYISLLSFLFSLVFKSHVLYFGFLYFIFGYYLINFIFLVYEHSKSIINSKWGGFLFLTFALSFSLRNSINMAFYTGAIFIIYYLAKSILESNIKLLLPIFFSPLLHASLVIVFIPLVLFLFLKEKTVVCFLLVVLSFTVPQSLVTGYLGDLADDNKATILESKYKSYASEDGMNRINKRYEKGRFNTNSKLSLLNNLKAFQFNYSINFGLIILVYFRQKLINNRIYIELLNSILLLWALSNIMQNISNGIRFQIFHVTLTLALFIIFLNPLLRSKLLRYYLSIIFPIAFIIGILNLYASSNFISINFYTSNFIIETLNSFYIEKVH